MAKAAKGRSLGDLGRRFNERAKMFQPIIDGIVQDTTYALVANLARNTPIDVGTARSNWIVSIIAPFRGKRAAFAPYPSRWRPPYGPGGSFGEGRNTAGATWSVPSGLRGRKAGQSVYITNNLPYIGRLNEGYSKQAPAGFVQRSITTALAQFEEIARDNFKAF